MAFEDNMTALADIVSQLEKGDLSLEKSVELYGKGFRLAAKCRTDLEKAKLKITQQGENKNESGS